MTKNFLKLNEDKTEAIEIGLYESCVTNIPLGSTCIELSDKVKNLGFQYDDKMSLNLQVNATTQKCYMNLRNLQRIGSKLTHQLKVQLVHSLVLSQLDYCNSVFGSLSEVHLTKLQKVQNSAVRFIYGHKGKEHKQSITPYLKELHFLPIRFRIKYKIALLVFKCLNNMAPEYLSEMVTLREPNRHSLRMDNDFYILNQPPHPNLRTSDGAFSVISPKLWNSLPYEIRCQSDLDTFKKALKTHLFELAFRDAKD